MGIQVGTIFKWVDPGESRFPDDEGESCEDGQCVGIVTNVILPHKTATSDKPTVMVKFWEKCDLHAEIDPDGTGPFPIGFIWQIGQLY